MGQYEELNEGIQRGNNLRILIIDNNNLEFCIQNKTFFPANTIFDNYDIILTPEWVHSEIAHSDSRLQYLASIPKPSYILSEEEDYTRLVDYQDYRLMRLFDYATSSITKARKKIGEFKSYYAREQDLPENWIADFCDNAFEINETTGPGGETIELRKNAGETSILVLAYLLVHHYSSKIGRITIFSSDKGSLTIKESIMDNLGKMELTNNVKIPITFKTTDILIAEACKDGRIQSSDILSIRSNPRTVIYTELLDDRTSHRYKGVLDTNEFIKLVDSIDKYHIEF
ncbi:hypothetical protein [Lysinibacillus sp. 3P01SB]|uniref:hypothetical protein n=1 Tax=Lysinibacillus sp. 3P01SB TaxID=3132284 RepID=UPI0039A769B7